MKHQGLGLQGRFLTGLACILFGCCVVSAVFIYLWGKQTLEEEAQKRTQLVLATVEAVQGYVREELRPRMYQVLGRDRFVLEAMSASYVSRAVMDRLRQHLPEIHYRRVSFFPLNPAFRTRPEERTMLGRLTASGRDSWEGLRNVGGQPHFLHYETVTYGPGCLRCHQDSDTVPAAIRSQYHNARFLPGATTPPPGLVGIGIPVDTSLARIKDRAFSVFVFAFTFLVVLYSVIAFFFDRVVVQSLRQLLAQFRDNLRDDEGRQLYEIAASRDAIDEITGAAQALAGHIRHTEQQLAEHACNLEALVEERTAALRHSQQQLQEKVRTRNRELAVLTGIAERIGADPGRTDTLEEILRLTLAVVPAAGAAIYLAGDDEDGAQHPPLLHLRCAEGVAELPQRLTATAHRDGDPETLAQVLAEAGAGRMGFLASETARLDALSIPLTSRGRVHGVMLFVAVDFMELDQETTTLLEAVGRQVGILVENTRAVGRLLESRALLQTVFDGITDPVALLDREFRIRMVNHSFRLRHNDDDLVGRDCRRIPGCPFATVDQWRFQSGHPASALVRMADDTIFEVHFYPLFDSGGALTHVVCYGKDVTEQKLAEERSQHTEKMAALGQLAAGVAHEINNPLGVILCHTDLVLGDPATPQQTREDVAVIERHARVCQKIVGALLQFARPQSGSRRPEDLNQVVSETVAMVQRQLEKEGITLELDLAPGLAPVAMDRHQIQQVLLNLLLNAVQAMEGASGTVTVRSWAPAPDRVAVAVADSGPGIDPRHLERIFDPFFSTKAAGKGTGLGLSVSYGIVRDHHGEIHAANRPEGGAVLTVTLPLT